jgi:hypothetical protein
MKQNACIHIATYQTLGLDDETDEVASFLTEHYPEDAFSVIIIDECHRSAWGKWPGEQSDFEDRLNKNRHIHVTCAIIERGGLVLASQRSAAMSMPAGIACTIRRKRNSGGIRLDRGYRILVFARDQKKRNATTVPFTYLGPVGRVSYERERPIKIVWR